MTTKNHQPDEFSYTPRMDSTPRPVHYVIREPGSTAPIVCPLLRESSTMQPVLTGALRVDVQSQTIAGVRSLKKLEIAAHQLPLLYPVKDAIRYSRAAFGKVENVTEEILIAVQVNAVWEMGNGGRVVKAYTEVTVGLELTDGRSARTLVPVILENTLNVIFED